MSQTYAVPAEGERRDFWQRHVLAPRTRRNDVFDFAFGLMLPILCMLLDPGFFYGGLSFGMLDRFVLGIYLTAGLTMMAIVAWLTLGGRSQALDAVLAGVLFTGGTVAFVVGCCIAPLSTIGLFVLVGALGFVPFFTSFVCFRACTRALNANDWRPAYLVAAIAALATLALAGGYQVGADRLIDRTVVEALQNPDPDAARVAIRRMDSWRPFVPRREVGRIGRGILLEYEDVPHARELRTAFQRTAGTGLFGGGGPFAGVGD